MENKIIAFGIVVLFTNGIEAMTGFGSTILAVAICINFIPLEFLVPVLILINLVLSSYIVVRHRFHIEMNFLFRQILPMVGIGAVFGSYLFNNLSNDNGFIKFFFGLFIAFLSLFQLVKTVFNPHNSEQNINEKQYKAFFWLIIGGIMQGMFASGGPMVVYQVSQRGMNKQSFRATLSALWFIINIFLVINYTLNGFMTEDKIKASLFLIPCVLGGIFLGENLHKRISEYYFRIIIYILLIVAAVALLFGK